MPRFFERDDELENALNRGALWAITYGDLMSYLMIFFLLLFVFAVAKEGKTTAYSESLAQIQRAFGGLLSPEELRKLAERKKQEETAKKIEEMAQNPMLSQLMQVTTTEEKIRLTLQSPILFDLNSADLKKDALPVLQELAGILLETPNDLVVEGHTDNIPVVGGRYQSNWELSMARAYGVVRFFEQAGVDPKRLSGAGYGENRPAEDNSTPAGQARNRRIEINLIKK